MIARVDGAREARRLLERNGDVTQGLLDHQVEASWRRCRAAGLDPRHVPMVRHLDAGALRERVAACGPVAGRAHLEMESLYHQIAGSNYMIAFGDADGIVIDTIADATFAASAAGRQIQPGTLWNEAQAGTNALGTASATGQSLIVHGAEHYFACFDGITCAAAPIHHHDGSLAGVLDASSFCDAYPAHTLAMVRMAALNVGNGLFAAEMGHCLILDLHPRAEFLGSIVAAMLAFDHDGILRGTSVQVPQVMPGVGPRLGQGFAELFGERFGTVFDRLARQAHTSVRDRFDRVYTVAWRNRAVGPSRALPLVAGDEPVQAGLLRVRGPGPAAATTPWLTGSAQAGYRSGLICDDPRLQDCLALVEAAARLPSPILICGETGTGKEMLARHAHDSSGRPGEFVAVNCAAMPADLFEAELFGYAPGAFTGAQREGRTGLLAAADRGTLLLDEVADLPLAMQAVLLRFLDDFEVRPVGGRTARRVDVLVVAACNVDLQQAVAERRFRADLWYRLNIVQACLPPLRDRTDLARLAQALLVTIDAEASLTDRAQALLATQAWPGNLRELRAVLTRARLRAGSGLIDAQHLGLPPAARTGPGAPVGRPDVAPAGLSAGAPQRIMGGSSTPQGTPVGSLRLLSSEVVLHTLEQFGGNVSATAQCLAISRNTVYRYLRQQGRS